MFFCQISHLGGEPRRTRRSGEAHAARRAGDTRRRGSLSSTRRATSPAKNSGRPRLVKVIYFEIAERLYI